MTPKVILGSSSPYRKELLSRLGIPFECVSPDVDETPLSGETPQALCQRLARLKAQAVHALRADTIVIGSDQVAVLGNKILGKPHTHERAVAQLAAMQGHRIDFLTALCIIDTRGQLYETMVPTEVHMKVLSAEAIEAYLLREKPYNCAGSAKIETLGIALMETVRSDDPTALIGLPLIATVKLLSKAGCHVLPGLE